MSSIQNKNHIQTHTCNRFKSIMPNKLINTIPVIACLRLDQNPLTIAITLSTSKDDNNPEIHPEIPSNTSNAGTNGNNLAPDGHHNSFDKAICITIDN
jgi:hypothetical protein